eukprot:1920267-Rhodomonas_salina.1
MPGPQNGRGGGGGGGHVVNELAMQLASMGFEKDIIRCVQRFCHQSIRIAWLLHIPRAPPRLPAQCASDKIVCSAVMKEQPRSVDEAVDLCFSFTQDFEVVGSKAQNKQSQPSEPPLPASASAAPAPPGADAGR